MLSIKPRVSVVAVIVLAFVVQLAVVPPSSAKPFGAATARSQDVVADWLSAAQHWLERVLAGGDSGPARKSATDGAAPNTGSCIDPHGMQTWCD